MDILHHQEIDPILVSHIVEHANMRMIQARNCPSFELEPSFHLSVIREICGKNLDRDDTVQVGIPRLVHFTHPAFAEGAVIV